jgi:hypothetical protein
MAPTQDRQVRRSERLPTTFQPILARATWSLRLVGLLRTLLFRLPMTFGQQERESLHPGHSGANAKLRGRLAALNDPSGEQILGFAQRVSRGPPGDRDGHPELAFHSNIVNAAADQPSSRVDGAVLTAWPRVTGADGLTMWRVDYTMDGLRQSLGHRLEVGGRPG